MYFPNVNFLRGFAALLVLVYHVIELTPWPEFPKGGPLLLFRVGWAGVDLFFVISGFVIGLSAIRLCRDGDRDYRWTFMRHRLARIVPLYVLTGAVFLFLIQPSLLLLPWAELAAHIGSHLLFLHNLIPALHGSIDGPNWSVAVEMQFYVLMIVAAPLLSRLDVRWVFAGGVLLAWTFRALAYWATRDLGNPHLIFVYATQVPSMLDAFAIGICIARLHLDGTVARWSMLHRALPLVATACAFLVLLYFGWRVYWGHANYWDNAWMVIFWRTALALTFGSLILLVAQLPDMTRVWPLRPLNYLGEISYGIYLWHLPVILALKPFAAMVSPERVLMMTLAGVVTLSALTWHLFEKPLIRRFR